MYFSKFNSHQILKSLIFLFFSHSHPTDYELLFIYIGSIIDFLIIHYRFSQFIGNLYVFFAFKQSEGEEKTKFIDDVTRKNIYITLSALSAAGVLFLFLLRRASTAEGEPVQNTQTGSGILSAIKLFGHGRILLLSVTFWFTGKFFS